MKEVTLTVENYFNNNSHIIQQYSDTKHPKRSQKQVFGFSKEVLETRRLWKEVSVFSKMV